MAWGRRCDLGCESWPDESKYTKCPECGEPTERFSNLRPLDPDEAQSRLNHLEFEAYYEDRCARLGISSDGPLGEPQPSSTAAYGPASRRSSA